MTEEIGKTYGIEMEEVQTKEKSEWKREVKKKIQETVDKEWKMKGNSMKKLRHIKGGRYERKKYILESTTEEVAEHLRIKLEMRDIGNNHGKERKCMCGEDELVEHLAECKEIEKLVQEKLILEDIKSEQKWKIGRAKKWIDKYIELRK